jgi:hypothetical protein
MGATADTSREEPGSDAVRLRWVEQAIAETATWIKQTRGEAEAEVMFSRPGDWDYDYATDLASETEKAEATLKALEAERDNIRAAQGLLMHEAQAGKYGDL